MKNTNIDHFNDEKPHTAIKHRLFKSVFDSCIQISSFFNNIKKEKRNFIYLDLYAGSGKFNDENLGSPLIALSSSKSQLESDSNNIAKVEMILSEQNEDNARRLTENVNAFISQEKLQKQVFPIVLAKHWENCKDQFSKGLNNSDWGMIFADPFSVELRLPDLKNLIFANSKLKDILILINTNAHERVLGRTDDESLSKIADYFGIELKMLRMLKKQVKDIEQLNNAVVIRRLINRSFKDINKDFVINVAITRSKDGELENADRFYLCLLTSSIGVANAFLDTYALLLDNKIKKETNGQGNLFANDENYIYFELKNKIKEITKGQKMTLLKLMSKLLNDFYSWKDASPNEIPNTKNVQKAINLLIDEKYLNTSCSEFIKNKFLYKDEKKLKSVAFQRKQNLREIYIFN